MPDTVPAPLATMRAITGTLEASGSADNPVIIAWREVIARAFTEMAAYARRYLHDSIAWCGHTVAYCMAMAGIRPPYNPNDDLKSYLWVDAWADWGTHVEPGQEQPGDVMVFASPHHVTLYESTDGASYVCRGGNQSDQVKVSRFAKSGIRVIRRPPAATVAVATGPTIPISGTLRPEIKFGDTGPYVVELQKLLGVEADGEFGPDTDAAVRAFQATHSLDIDGEVGEQTWPSLLAAAKPAPSGAAVLSPEAIARIVSISGSSALANVHWSDRGVAPRGYIKGMAVTFAKVYLDWKAGGSAARVMAALPAGDTTHDALAWYGMGMTNVAAGAASLRALFALLIGLGMRESSGNYSEGRDTSASNTSADTAEAGLFQQSWNSHSASPELEKLWRAYAANTSDGFLSIFREGVNAKSTDDFGSGEGMAFQHLCKTKPAFAVECAAVGLRVLRQHWGPINRREAEIRPEADALLLQVQQVVDAVVTPPVTEPIIIPPGQTGEHEPPPFDRGALIAAAMLFFMELKMTGQAPDLTKLFDLIENPVLHKLFSGGAVTRAELRTLPGAVLAALGHSQPALPAPATTVEPEPVKVEPEPVKVESAPVAPPPATPPVSPLWANLGTAGTLLSGIAALWAGGAMPDTTALVSSAAATALSFTGIPAPLINGVLSLFKGLKITRTAA